ncbi:MAG TPA: HD domain-containing phosphohydrolase [Terriglobales bacterium]|nr:HD domain-containing phosphohydrolase [Terriglobales bacterium]
MPKRIPILHLILAVLVLVSVVPLYFYADKVVATNRERLKTNEQLSQNTVTRSMSDQIDLRQKARRAMLDNFSSAVQIASGGNITGDHVAAPELRALLERFVSSSTDIAYATLLNEGAKGISAGRMVPDVFIQRDLERAFTAARDGRDYTGQPLTVGSGKDARTVVLVSAPLMADTRFIGMIGAVVDLEFIVKRLREADQGGLFTYVVDHQGRLVAAADPSYATGQDMTKFEIVKNFAEQGVKVQLAQTSEFDVKDGKESVPMLGTYSPVQTLGWAVVAQKKQKDAYQGVFEMERSARLWAFFAVLMSIVVSVLAARSITRPLDILTESSQAIAKGDFSKRVQLKSRTEFGELADTFNSMSSDLERFVQDLKRAAEENRELFMGSIQMLAGAVDEKDPYTRGHSDRVTKYSVLLAKELGLEPHEVEKIQISAQLHDVGKIGIEDRILKKPGALTPDEFEIMKTHTTKGATILRPVTMLKDMIPGIELHHESLDGRGYPYGLKGDQIPLVARIITVADTFDAMTTNRPYQAAMDPEYVVRIINSLANTKFDPKVVSALTAVFERGDLKIRRAAAVQPEAVPAGAAAGGAAPQPVSVAKS